DAVFFKMQYPTEVLAYMGIVTIIAAGSMLLGLVLQGLGRFKVAWMVLLIVPVLGIVEFVLMGGFYAPILGLFAGYAAYAFRGYAIDSQLEALASSR
ncbi:MAG: hypothetical protein AAFX99_17080, partial [Myxococcota bacterium]